jgi:tetratricopeptide (TPR) repeat protein
MCKHNCICSAICKRGFYKKGGFGTPHARSLASKTGTLAPKALVLGLQVFVAAVLFCLPAAAQIPDAFRSSFGWRVDEFDTMNTKSTVLDAGIGAFPSPPQQGRIPPKVSADVLRHPISLKARRFLLKALAFAEKGEHTRAIATLKEGIQKERTLVPYSHGLLGTEYLRLGLAAEAMPEFVEDVRAFPHDATTHSNLALILCMASQFDRAEQEARIALYLDPTLSPAQEIMRIIVEDKAKMAR